MVWFYIVGVAAFAVFVISKMLFPNWIKDHPWMGATAIFIDIGMLIGIGQLNPLVAAIILMTIVAFIALWNVLCVIGIHSDGRAIKSLELDQSTLKSSKKSLTNGAAILSVISCYTTANGMRDVVFGGWLAYPASIAVQVTLAFLSFFLLRFILAVQDLNWPKALERVVSYVLVFVTVGYLIMSSLFSYSFIVTKAYEKTRNENNEAIARTYFTETATLLESENNKRGVVLYSALSNAINDTDGLSLAIQTQQTAENEELNKKIISALDGVSNITVSVTIEQEADFSDMENFSGNSTLENTKSNLLQVNDRLQKRVDSLNSALSELNDIKSKDAQTLSDNDRNTIKRYYDNLYGNNENSAEKTLNQISDTTNQINTGNRTLKNHIIRTQIAISDLRDIFGKLKTYLADAYKIIDTQESQSIQNSVNNISIQTTEDILKRINEIQIKAEVSSTQEDAKNDLNDLLEDVDSWTASQNLTSQTVEKIRSFCEDLKEYRKYIELKQTLENFNETAIKKVYVVVSSEENEKTVGDFSYITEAKWMSARNENFYTLENSVALLPEYPAASDGQLENPSEENAAKISEIPSKAIQMQRILFAELTDVERAINYFGKEYTGYRKMAVFSVVMAVFFDLGAFISGNLVMLIEYFIKESPKDNDSAHSQQDKNQEKEMAQIH